MNTKKADNVVYLKKPKRFSLAQAREILPEIKKITEQAALQADPIIDELETQLISEHLEAQLSARLQSIVDDWSEEVLRLGAHPKGLWLIDFDFGEGYYCWQLGEDEVEHFHGYKDGFLNRTRIQ